MRGIESFAEQIQLHSAALRPILVAPDFLVRRRGGRFVIFLRHGFWRGQGGLSQSAQERRGGACQAQTVKKGTARGFRSTASHKCASTLEKARAPRVAAFCELPELTILSSERAPQHASCELAPGLASGPRGFGESRDRFELARRLTGGRAGRRSAKILHGPRDGFTEFSRSMERPVRIA